MKNPLQGAFRDRKGAASEVFRLVLAVTLAAAVIMILLQMLAQNREDLLPTSANLTSAAKQVLEDSMKTITD